MKRTTLSALLLGMVLALGMTSTSNAQFYEETSWSSSRNYNSNTSWSVGPGGMTTHTTENFGGHDAMNTTVITPTRINHTSNRTDFGGYNEIGRTTRPVPGGIETTGFNNNGAWRTTNGSEINMGSGGNYVRGSNTFNGFDSSSGFRDFNGFGGSSGTRFDNYNEVGGGNTWYRGW
jgi:hypothetical protein